MRQSPVVDDVLLFKEKDGTTRKVTKLLREASFCDLHNDLHASTIPGLHDRSGQILISYENLRLLLKTKLPELRRASNKHKLMRRCEICFIAMYAQ